MSILIDRGYNSPHLLSRIQKSYIFGATTSVIYGSISWLSLKAGFDLGGTYLTDSGDLRMRGFFVEEVHLDCIFQQHCFANKFKGKLLKKWFSPLSRNFNAWAIALKVKSSIHCDTSTRDYRHTAVTSLPHPQ
jgi:hypothetical protein